MADQDPLDQIVASPDFYSLARDEQAKILKSNSGQFSSLDPKIQDAYLDHQNQVFHTQKAAQVNQQAFGGWPQLPNLVGAAPDEDAPSGRLNPITHGETGGMSQDIAAYQEQRGKNITADTMGNLIPLLGAGAGAVAGGSTIAQM